MDGWVDMRHEWDKICTSYMYKILVRGNQGWRPHEGIWRKFKTDLLEKYSEGVKWIQLAHN